MRHIVRRTEERTGAGQHVAADRTSHPKVVAALQSLEARAQRVRGGMLAGDEAHRYQTYESELPYLSDVTLSVDRFAASLAIADQGRFNYPCLGLQSGDAIPIDFLGHAFGAIYPRRPRRPLERLRNISKGLIGRLLARTYRGVTAVDGEIVEMRPDDAYQTFSHHLSDFVGRRIVFEEGAARERAQAQRSMVGSNGSDDGQGLPWDGLTTQPPFKVITGSKGRRVHFAGRYFIRPDEVFGSPSSPVTRGLGAGTYIFGVFDPVTMKVRYAPNAPFSVPELDSADLPEL